MSLCEYSNVDAMLLLPDFLNSADIHNRGRMRLYVKPLDHNRGMVATWVVAEVA